MRLACALENTAPVHGMASVLRAAFDGDMASVTCTSAQVDVLLADATAEAQRYKDLVDRSTSDAAYWGYLGSQTYWEMVVNLVTAATLVGPENLPDVPLPKRDGIVMDLLSAQSAFGLRVLELARQSLAQEIKEVSVALSDAQSNGAQ